MKIKDYFTPKSFIYTGEHQTIQTSIKNYQYNASEVIMTEDFKKKEGFKRYIQVVGLSNVEKIEKLKDIYEIESVILEDVFNVRQRNKIELRNGYIFAVMHVEFLKNNQIHNDYMSLMLFKDTLISFHEKDPLFLDALPELIKNYAELKSSSVDFLFYQILDIITDHHLDVYDELDESATEFEEDILESKKVNQEEFYVVRKNLLKLKNSVTPILEQLEKVLSKNSDLISPQNHIYFDDLKDHLARLDGQLSQSRENLRQLLDLHMNNQSNQMNKVMTTLTLFSAIFIPLSFLTGFFGMNFIFFEVLEYPYAIPGFIGFCFLLAVFMIFFFKRKKWL
jgi:magnesium transporter